MQAKPSRNAPGGLDVESENMRCSAKTVLRCGSCVMVPANQRSECYGCTAVRPLSRNDHCGTYLFSRRRMRKSASNIRPSLTISFLEILTLAPRKEINERTFAGPAATIYLHMHPRMAVPFAIVLSLHLALILLSLCNAALSCLINLGLVYAILSKDSMDCYCKPHASLWSQDGV